MKKLKVAAALLAAQMLLSALPMVAFASLTVDDVYKGISENEWRYLPIADKINYPEYTPAENVFYVEEQPFIMLDSTEDKDSTFFLYANEGVATYPYYGDQMFEPNASDQGLVCYILNHSYIDGTWGSIAFPQSFKAYLDTNHEWATEAGASDSKAQGKAYTFKAPVTLRSLTELLQYSAKIGYKFYDGDIANYVCLRSGGKDAWNQILRTDTNGNVAAMGTNENGLIRPCFWIGEDFFKNVHLDVSKMGANVKAELTDRYTEEDLKAAGYTTDELSEIGYGKEQVEAEITGTLKPGYTVTAVYNKVGNYQWYRCDSPEDEGEVIDGETVGSYQLKNADGEKYLKFVVSKTEKLERLLFQNELMLHW